MIPFRRSPRGFTLIEITIVIVILAVLAMILLPNYVRARSRGRLSACETNLRNMASALEVYSTDNARQFPSRLEELSPTFVQSIPTCPSAGSSAAYLDGFTSARNPAAYTLSCTGGWHVDLGLGENSPSFHYGTGLVK